MTALPKPATSEFDVYDDRELDAAITAWGVACTASRHLDHIDEADRIRNQLIGERLRRSRIET